MIFLNKWRHQIKSFGAYCTVLNSKNVYDFIACHNYSVNSIKVTLPISLECTILYPTALKLFEFLWEKNIILRSILRHPRPSLKIERDCRGQRYKLMWSN